MERGWQGLIFVLGSVVLIVGVALLLLPGPGWLIIFLGLGILAAEFAWAQRLLHRARGRYDRAVALAQGRRSRRKDSASR